MVSLNMVKFDMIKRVKSPGQQLQDNLVNRSERIKINELFIILVNDRDDKYMINFQLLKSHGKVHEC